MKYTEKCVALLNIERFKRLTTDPTAATERKIENLAEFGLKTPLDYTFYGGSAVTIWLKKSLKIVDNY